MKKAILAFLLLSLAVRAFSQSATDAELAMQFYKNGEWDKALPLYKSIFNKTKQPEYYDLYLNVLLKLKNFNEAKNLIKTLIAEQPANYTYRVDYGRTLREQGDQEKADDWYKGLIKELPANEFAIRDMAMSFYRASAYDYSVKTFITGRKLLKDDSAFAFELISLYRFQKDKQMLVKEYLQLLAKNPEPGLLNQAKNTFASVLETAEDYSILKGPLLLKAQKEKRTPQYSDLLSWVYIQQGDFQQAVKEAISGDKKFRGEGDLVYDLVMTLISNRAYTAAESGLAYLITKGPESPYYIPAKIQYVRTRYQSLTEGNHTKDQLLKIRDNYLDLLKEFGRTKNTVFAMRQLANLQAFYLDNPSEAEILLEEVLKIPQLPSSVKGQSKLELGDVYILTGELWEAALVYGQVEKEFANDPIGQEAKFRNAKLSYYQADFAWAKAQLDVLKSSTSQLIANDALNLSLLIAENTETKADTDALTKYALAERLFFSNQGSRAIMVLDSIDVLFPGNSLSDDILMAKSRIYLKHNDLPRAISCLREIIEKFGYDIWADDALFSLAEIYETRLHDNQNARFYYQKIITDFPGSVFVIEARKRFRNLRGDTLG